MKKIFGVLLAFTLVFLALGTATVSADDGLLSEFVKQGANQHCGYSAELVEPQSEIIQDATINSTGFTSQTGTSVSGSKFIMPATPFVSYGYCHIFKGHMNNSNGLKGETDPNTGKSLFRYAYYPEKTMKIAMEVMNLQDTRVPGTDGRYTKEIYSPTEGQVVRVSFNITSNFAGGKYSPTYDYVIVSMYPVY